MKNFKTFILGTLFLGIFMVSCSKEEATSFEIENATDVITKFNDGKLDFQQGEVIYGEAYMRSTNDDQLLVFVRNADFDEKTLLYKLQTEKLENPLFKEVFDKVQILYFRNQLIINDLGSSRRFSLRLSDVNDNLKVEEEGSLISGFGLVRMTVDLNSENDNSAVLREDNNDLQSVGGEPGTSQPVGTLGCVCRNDLLDAKVCSSGGEGSLSCSGNYDLNPSGEIGPCSVSCTGIGNYACCGLSL